MNRWVMSEYQTRGGELPAPAMVTPDLMKKQMKRCILLFASPVKWGVWIFYSGRGGLYVRDN